jgi:hypothetical protein
MRVKYRLLKPLLLDWCSRRLGHFMASLLGVASAFARSVCAAMFETARGQPRAGGKSLAMQLPPRRCFAEFSSALRPVGDNFEFIALP